MADYIEYKFAQYAYNILETYDPNADGPLFLNYDFHIAHLPMQVPTQYFNRFNFMKDGEWSDGTVTMMRGSTRSGGLKRGPRLPPRPAPSTQHTAVITPP